MDDTSQDLRSVAPAIGSRHSKLKKSFKVGVHSLLTACPREYMQAKNFIFQQLTQKEWELIQERFEMKNLANFLMQASEDARRLVSQERSFACDEIESARAIVLRFGEAPEQEQKLSQISGKQDVKELLEEIQEARRIRLMHQPSKVLEMEHELRELRMRIREKAIFSVKLQKELVTTKRTE